MKGFFRFNVSTFHAAKAIDRRPMGSEILANLDQQRRHMSERAFYADTNDGSSTSKIVACNIA
jgi:hypothetical protein